MDVGERWRGGGGWKYWARRGRVRRGKGREREFLGGGEGVCGGAGAEGCDQRPRCRELASRCRELASLIDG